ncbi:MAG: type II secretion system GspH family protein [Puniceicoccales bacterium]|jgi:prepilin-type N-terminal cleavage/methylation domain-containing protein|nr:type II secretion system GspH family protein [Puniceicoccales bacterium]
MFFPFALYQCVRRSGKKNAFTLIEMLTVISIIGILAAILMPVISNAIGEAKKLKVSKGLQQIAMAYASLSLKGFTRELNSCENAAQWAGIFSKYGELNAASMFIAGDDYLVETERNPLPKSIGFVKNGTWQMNADFKNFPLSVTVISGISSQARAETTPIAYTRGLDNNTGKWRGANGNGGGIYGETGGFIVFLDGHVEFYSNISDERNMLINYYTGEKTSKISEAVNSGARALSWTGVEWEAEKK